MNIAQFLSILAGVIGILSFTGAVLNGKLKDGKIDLLQSGNDELRKQADDKDKIITALDKDKTYYKTKFEAATEAATKAEEARIEALNLAQSRPAFETLGETMIKQHRELLGAIGKQTAKSSSDMLKLTKTISNLATIISKNRGDK